MCLAIYKPSKAVIPKEWLENGHEHNGDGCGFCYSEGGKLHVQKGMWSFDEFYKKYQEKEHLAMLIHFRFGTHGGKNVLNCHPFTICDGKYALIHNGVIPIECTIKELSDTGNFAKLVMEPMLSSGVHPKKPSFFFLVEQAVGPGNKILLMDNNGEVTIYNEDAGEYEEAFDKDNNVMLYLRKDGTKHPIKIWFSNGGYKYGRRRKITHHDEYEGYYDGSENYDVAQKPIGFAAGTTLGKSAKESANVILNIYDDATHGILPPVNGQGKYPPNIPANSEKKQTIKIMLPPIKDSSAAPPVIIPLNNNTDDDHGKITDVTEGPVYGAKTELEIAYLVSEMNMIRSEAIKYLGLTLQEASITMD